MKKWLPCALKAEAFVLRERKRQKKSESVRSEEYNE